MLHLGEGIGPPHSRKAPTFYSPRNPSSYEGVPHKIVWFYLSYEGISSSPPGPGCSKMVAAHLHKQAASLLAVSPPQLPGLLCMVLPVRAAVREGIWWRCRLYRGRGNRAWRIRRLVRPQDGSWTAADGAGRGLKFDRDSLAAISIQVKSTPGGSQGQGQCGSALDERSQGSGWLQIRSELTEPSHSVSFFQPSICKKKKKKKCHLKKKSAFLFCHLSLQSIATTSVLRVQFSGSCRLFLQLGSLCSVNGLQVQ